MKGGSIFGDSNPLSTDTPDVSSGDSSGAGGKAKKPKIDKETQARVMKALKRAGLGLGAISVVAGAAVGGSLGAQAMRNSTGSVSAVMPGVIGGVAGPAALALIAGAIVVAKRKGLFGEAKELEEKLVAVETGEPGSGQAVSDTVTAMPPDQMDAAAAEAKRIAEEEAAKNKGDQ